VSYELKKDAAEIMSMIEAIYIPSLLKGKRTVGISLPKCYMLNNAFTC